MIANIQTIDFPVLGDERGKLIALEALTEQIPFDVKRVYYIFDTTFDMCKWCLYNIMRIA